MSTGVFVQRIVGGETSNVFNALAPCKQKRFQQVSSWLHMRYGLRTGSKDWMSCGRTDSGEISCSNAIIVTISSSFFTFYFMLNFSVFACYFSRSPCKYSMHEDPTPPYYDS